MKKSIYSFLLSRRARLCGAMLLERAGHALLASTPPYPRRFAHMLQQAAMLYESCGLMEQACHAILEAASVYENSGWPAVRIHRNREGKRREEKHPGVFKYVH